MKIGVRLTGAMARLSLDDNLTWMAAHGFGDLEAGLTDGLSARARSHGVTVWAAAMGSIRLITDNDSARENAITAAKATIDSAAQQGIGVLCCGHAMVEGKPFADQISFFRDGFGPVAAYAEQKGVKLAFENWPNRGRNLMHCPELWDAAFTAVPSPALGLNFDPSHLVVLHIDWAWALRTYRSRVVYCHAKDTELFPDRLNRHGIFGPFVESGGPASGMWWRYRLPGFGVVNWHKYADILAEIGYAGPMNIEHEDQVWGFTQDIERMREGLLVAKQYLETTLF
ncbi:MAG: sugar phosphate isomerase/epimerase [Chloroflexi bacterium]|nr:sugar phosphate isomerase/epimerase [Chloroflexota bacterium]